MKISQQQKYNSEKGYSKIVAMNITRNMQSFFYTLYKKTQHKPFNG